MPCAEAELLALAFNAAIGIEATKRFAHAHRHGARVFTTPNTLLRGNEPESAPPSLRVQTRSFGGWPLARCGLSMRPENAAVLYGLTKDSRR